MINNHQERDCSSLLAAIRQVYSNKISRNELLLTKQKAIYSMISELEHIWQSLPRLDLPLSEFETPFLMILSQLHELSQIQT